MYVINCEFSGVNARIKAFSSGEGGSQRLTDEEGKNSSNNGYKVEILLSSSTADAVPLLRWRRLPFLRIWNTIFHQISAKISVFFRSKAEEKALTAVSEKASRCDPSRCSHQTRRVTHKSKFEIIKKHERQNQCPKNCFRFIKGISHLS